MESMSSSDLELILEGSTAQTVGMRFTTINIPQGATIDSAYIQFTVDETDTETTNLTIKGHDVDNSSTFTTTNKDISNRTPTTASVAWNSIPSWSTVGDAGAAQKNS